MGKAPGTVAGSNSAMHDIGKLLPGRGVCGIMLNMTEYEQ